MQEVEVTQNCQQRLTQEEFPNDLVLQLNIILPCNKRYVKLNFIENYIYGSLLHLQLNRRCKMQIRPHLVKEEVFHVELILH